MNIKKQWLKACKTHKTYEFFQKNIPTDRLKRLFTVACCDHIRHLFVDIRSLKAIEIAELYADNLATDEELITTHNNAYYAAYAVAAANSSTAYYAAYAAAVANSTAYHAAPVAAN